MPTAIASGLAHSSLNSILVTPTHLFAVCRYDEAEELQEEEPEYYRLRYRILPQRVVVASSGWGRGGRDRPARSTDPASGRQPDVPGS